MSTLIRQSWYNIYVGCVNFKLRGYVLNVRPMCEHIIIYQMCGILWYRTCIISRGDWG